MRTLRYLLPWLAVAACATVSKAGDEISAGPLFEKFNLTLESGQRTEMLGPMFFDEWDTNRQSFGVPPLFSSTVDEGKDLKELDFLYPLLTYDQYGEEYRFQFLQVLSWDGGPTTQEIYRNRFTLFPIYFQTRSSIPGENYTAVFPIYGHLKHRLFRDEIFFVMFPIYGRSVKKDKVTDNYFYPFFHVRHGNDLNGWQVWPFAGGEVKGVTYETNGFGDVTLIGGYDDTFYMWPFYFNQHRAIGTDNAEWDQVSFPFYSIQRSLKRDSTSALWLFSHVNDREKQYREWDMPWPFVGFARGEGKTENRIIPFFSVAHNRVLESDSYAWPIYRYTHLKSAPLDRERARILYWVYSNLTEKNTETGAYRHRVDAWPFLCYERDFSGRTRWQALALIESFLPGSHKIRRDYSPIWSIWRAENNPQTESSSQSLLWNLYRHDRTPETRKWSCLFGLFQSSKDDSGTRVRLFYIPFGGKKAKDASPTVPAKN